MRDALIVFVKEPRPGAVKTRLAARLGAALAARLYRALVENALRATADPAVERLVFASGDVASWLAGETCLPQAQGDLGRRMEQAFGVAFARGHRRVAIAGSDVPGLDARRVKEALDALDDADLAIAPAGDGGYSLLALSQPRPELFRGIAWSTASVLDETRDAARGLRVKLLEELPDLDTFDDLERQWERLRAALPAELSSAVERCRGG